MVAIRLSHERGFAEPAADLSLAEGQLSVVFLGGALDAPPPASVLSSLHEHERASVALMPARRARTWVGGRIALRRALASCDARITDPRPILSTERGGPHLPAGLLGSIAHKDAVAVALAAQGEGFAIGVDVEEARPLASGLERRILTTEEIAELDAGGLDEVARGLERARRFAAKEAVYKAIDPFLGRWVGFLEVVLAEGAEGYAVRGPVDGRALAVEVRVLDLGDVFVALARARPA